MNGGIKTLDGVKKVPAPRRLNIELTTHCCCKCIMCRGKKNYVTPLKKDKHLTVNEFKTVLAGIDLDKLTILNLAGKSEPLMNPDIIPILSICKKSGIIIEVITNGMFLSPEISKQLLGNASDLHISFAGCNKETFESIRQGANFNQICENIKFFSKLKKLHNCKFPYIWINPILMKRNIQELPGIVHLAKELGCQGVASSHLVVNSPELIDESLFFYKEESNYFLTEANRIAKEDKIALVIPELFSEKHSKQTQPWKNCKWLWEQAMLGVETIVPCCVVDLDLDFDGNLSKNRFVDIWNNDWYAKMRHRLLTDNPPEKCRNCADPSRRDPNHMGSYFTNEILAEATGKQ